MDDVASIFDSAEAELSEQYRAGRDGVVAIDRSHLRRVAVTGADRETFLHNMLSADVKRLVPGTGCEATFLTNKGKLVASFVVLREDDRFILETESERVEPLTGALSRYVISEDVSIAPLDEASFSLEGPAASALVTELTGVDVDELDHLATTTKDGVRITARRQKPGPRFDIAAGPTRAAELLGAAKASGAVIGTEALAEIRRIESGRPRFGVDMDETHLPLEAALDDAISFDKGCYIGQEYVVRLAHRGQLRRKLVGIRIEGDEPPPSGATVAAGDADVGTVTSAAFSPTVGAVVALGYVRREAFEPGTAVTVGGRPGVVSARPFL